MNEAAFEAFTIEAEEAGQRLDVLLAARLHVSRARAQKLLESVTVNGVAAKSSLVLKTGDEITVQGNGSRVPSDTAVSIGTDAPLPLILFEDEYLIVLNKPRGLAVHPGAGEQQSTLVDILRAHGRQLSNVGPPERAGIVHRLDKDTSGVMMVCKTDAAHWKLAADFAERRITKLYKAIVCGVPPARGRIEAPIARHPVNRKKMTIEPTGRPSVTEYSVEQAWLKFALLQIKLLTGRTHQIRVHLAYIQHPVVGDAVYNGLHRTLQSAPNETARAAIEALSGQALHAYHLAFTHPLTGEAMEFEAVVPDRMQRVVESLG